ncbi:MAG: SpoIID/LytB domain-containing protein [Bifidobacteriaceae bacterium]|jgi:SpoIID/LytB domain protein|nr:SpoIID/LytB domain-containing protein [Bifidobacteriaceae bacterium]
MAATALVLPNAATPSAAAVPASFSISGAGWGHGVGMSQYGAQEMAKAGNSAGAILGFYYPGTTTANRNLGNIRVQLKQAATVVVRYAGAAGALTPAGGSATSVARGGVITLTVSGQNVVANGAGAAKTARQFGLTWNGAANCSGYVTVDGSSGGASGYCRGSMTATVINGKVNLIVTVGLARDYIYGLQEVPSSWQPAALQAQATAARSYAVKQAYKDSCNCEVYSDTRSQAYAGRSKEVESGGWGARWVSNVNATAPSASSGALLLYNGSPIAANYSAANGGSTESSADIWGNSLPYLVAKADPWSVKPDVPDSIKAWKVTKTQAEMKAIFGLTDVASVTITAKTGGGSAKTITARTAGGATKTISGAETIRSAFGLKSAHFSISSPTAPTTPPTAVNTPFVGIVLTADLTGDSRGDVVALDRDGRLVLYPFVRSGDRDKFESNHLLASGLSGHRVNGASDWNRDGYGDLISIDPQGGLHLRFGQPGRSLAAPFKIGGGWQNWRAIPVADISGDGWPDLLGIDANGILWAWRGCGNAGVCSSRVQLGAGWQNLKCYSAGDVNGDGIGDIFSVDAAGKLWLHPGHGRTNFGPRSQIGAGWNNFYLVSGADANGDRFADLMSRQESSRKLYFYRNSAGSTFASPVQVGAGW